MANKTNKSATPIWMKVMLIVIAVVIVGAAALAIFQSSGLNMRMTTVYETENFKVSGAVMQYLVKTQYMNYYSSYSGMISYFSLNPNYTLKSQTYGSGLESYIESFEGTWFDYFWSKAEANAKQTLAYCEAAKKAGVALDDEDKKDIDNAIEVLKASAKSLDVSLGRYIGATYGEGIKLSDIRDALELSTLASKYYNQETEKINDAVTADDVDKYAEENKSEFTKADYMKITFEASFKPAGDVPSVSELENFNKDITKVKTNAEELSKITDETAFKKYMISFWTDTQYENYYTEASKSLKEDEIPDADTVKAKRDAMLLAVDDAVLNETAIADLEKSGDTAFDEVMDAVRDKLINYINTQMKNIRNTGVSYSDTTDADLWIFNADRKAKDSTVIYSDAKVAEEGATAESKTTFTADVYLIEKPAYVDETVTKSFGHVLAMIDSDNEDKDAADAEAKARADKFLADLQQMTLTKDSFEAYAKENTDDSGVFYENVKKNQVYSEIEDWIYDENRKEGDLEIVKSASAGYHVMYFVGDGDIAWKLDAKNALINEKVEAFNKSVTEANEVKTVTENYGDKISA